MTSKLTRDVFPRRTYALEIDGNGSTMPEFKFTVDVRHAAYTAIDQGAKRVVVIRVNDINGDLSFEPLYIVTAPETDEPQPIRIPSFEETMREKK